MRFDSVLVTGVAGFIGHNTSLRLLSLGKHVIGIDNLADNYDKSFKKANLKKLQQFPKFKFHQETILNKKSITKLFQNYPLDAVVHLAALTGVRASLTQPKQYEEVNITGTKNVFDISQEFGIKSFIFSSSSSIYGDNKTPFKETQTSDPKSPYAKSKALAERLIKKTRKKMPTTILRFFSVYGPAGRPDMAPYIFTESALKNKEIIQYGQGKTARDYTYVDDVVDAIVRAFDKNFTLETINIGNSDPIMLADFIRLIERTTGKKIKKKIHSIRTEESAKTFASIEKAKSLLAWKPQHTLEQGIKKFVQWYKENRL